MIVGSVRARASPAAYLDRGAGNSVKYAPLGDDWP